MPCSVRVCRGCWRKSPVSRSTIAEAFGKPCPFWPSGGSTWCCWITTWEANAPASFFPRRQIGFEGRVLVVTAWVSDTEARRLMRQVVAGIFLKERPLSELMESVRTVVDGGTWLDRSFDKMEEPAAAGGQTSVPVFNERQRRVLRFVLEGLSNQEIAWRLQISESYVKAILQSLFEKTGVRTRGQLVRVAVEQYEDQL